MDVYSIDFETAWSKDYSLSKKDITTQNYIDDERYETIGVSVKKNSEEPQWFSGTHEETKDWLKQFDWESSFALMHNALFDATILAWKFGIYPKLILCTLSMARAVHGVDAGGSLAKLAERYNLGVKGTEVVDAMGKRRADFSEAELARYGEYCKNDVALTYDLFRQLASSFDKTEIALIDMTIKMHTMPQFELDRGILEEHLQNVRQRKEQLLDECGIVKDDLMSNPKLAEVLKNFGVEPPTKISPTTGKETYAFAKSDEAFKALLEHEDERVQAIVAARLGVKSTIEETRTERFIRIHEAGGALPVPLKYYGAITGRWSAVDSINLQNIPRGSKLKKAIIAPMGYSIVGADLSNIELRVGLAFAGQMDKLEMLGDGLDLYKDFASKAFDVAYESVDDDQRFVGKTASLSLIYGTGAKKLRAQCKMLSGRDIGEEFSQNVVNIYRKDYSQVRAAWYDAGRALEAIVNNEAITIGLGELKLDVLGRRGIRLPSGLFMAYPDLKITEDEQGRKQWVYGTRKGLVHIHPAKVFQNCLAEGTEVLTSNGWKAIENIEAEDLVHDGVEFVHHRGKVFQSVQACVSIDGVLMTPDHEVLTNEGWKAASQNPEPYRPNIWISDCTPPRSQRWETALLGIPLRLWNAISKKWKRRCEGGQTRRGPKLWVYDAFSYEQEEHKAWNVEASGLPRMGQYESQMPKPTTQGIQKLWSTGNKCLRQMEAFLREFLGGYGEYVPAWIGTGQNGQQWGLHSRELPLGRSTHKYYEQTEHLTHRHSAISERFGNRTYYSVQQAKSRVAGGTVTAPPRCSQQKRKVYDILNCGPRHRFVVKGASGPFVVHNCIQALARCVMGEAMVRVHKRYPIGLTIHDALYCAVRAEEADQARIDIITELRKAPTWLPNMPLDAEGGFGSDLSFKMKKLEGT
jgi:DNA polymerase